MNRLRLTLVLLAITVVCSIGIAQQPTKGSFLSEASKLVARGFKDRKALQENANRLALKYRKQLGQVGANVSRLEKEASTRFGQTDWQQKGALLMELWKIRSSIDLMALLSPEVLKEITGCDVPDLKVWMNGIRGAEAKLSHSFFGG